EHPAEALVDLRRTCIIAGPRQRRCLREECWCRSHPACEPAAASTSPALDDPPRTRWVRGTPRRTSRFRRTLLSVPALCFPHCSAGLAPSSGAQRLVSSGRREGRMVTAPEARSSWRDEIAERGTFRRARAAPGRTPSRWVVKRTFDQPLDDRGRSSPASI